MRECTANTYHQDSGRHNTSKDAQSRLKEAFLVAQHGKESLLEQKRRTEGSGKWPAKYPANCEPKHASRRLHTTAPVHESGSSDHDHVHGKAGRQVRGAGMEVAWAEYEGQDEEEADPGVQRPTNDPPHQGLAESADEGEGVAYEVELGNLCTNIPLDHSSQKMRVHPFPTFEDRGSNLRRLPTMACRPM